MSVQPLAFTGISMFSADFQKILNRAVSIASVPLTDRANQRADGLSQKHMLSNLNGAVAGLAGALRTLGELGVNKAVWGSSSNPAKVTVTGTTASAPASYSLSEITSLARAASATSAGYATSGTTVVSATGTVKITFRGVEETIVLAPEQNTLIGLRDRINELGMGVVASALTTGTVPSPTTFP